MSEAEDLLEGIGRAMELLRRLESLVGSLRKDDVNVDNNDVMVDVNVDVNVDNNDVNLRKDDVDNDVGNVVFSQENVNIPRKVDAKKSYECPFCSKLYASRQTRSKHKKICPKRPKPEPTIKTTPKPMPEERVTIPARSSVYDQLF